MVLLPFVIGSALALAVVVTAWNYRRMPARRLCPLCAGDTAPLTLSGAVRSLHPWIQARWCVDCGWEGFGRRGPSFDPMRGPAAHDSGFRWNQNAAPTGVRGFEWGSPEPVAPERDRVHPSGFRWAPTEVDADDAMPDPAHPSGFRWAGSSPTAEEWARDAAHPSGFRWGAGAPAPRDPMRGFVWKNGGDTFA